MEITLRNELLSERSGVRIPFGTPKKWEHKLCFLFLQRSERDSKASVKKTCRWHVFSERVAETYNSAHAAASVAESFSLHRIPFGTPNRTLPRIRKVCFLATFVFYEGFEGERAEHSKAKTSRCDVFSERVAETYNSAHAAASVAECLCLYQYPFGTSKEWKHKLCFHSFAKE